MKKVNLQEGEEITISINGKDFRLSAGFDTMSITVLNGSLVVQPQVTNQIKIKQTNDRFDLPDTTPTRHKVFKRNKMVAKLQQNESIQTNLSEYKSDELVKKWKDAFGYNK